MSKQTPLSDAGVGRALFTTRFRLSLQAAIMCFTFGALPLFVACYVLWFTNATPMDVDVVKFDLVSRVVPEKSLHRWHFRQNGVTYGTLAINRADGSQGFWMTSAQAREVMADRMAPVDVFHNYVLLSLIAAVLGYGTVWMFLRRLGSGSQDNQRLRGAKLVVDGKTLDSLVRRDRGGSYTLADVAIPKAAPTGGILIEGSQGSGKSLAIHDLMLQAFAKKRKCVIFDESGEFFRAHFRPGKDVFFNPALKGSVGWSLFNELIYTYDADTLGYAFLPPDPGTGNQFFKDAARALFSTMLLRLSQAGAVNTRDIAAAILSMPADEMSHLIRDTVASSSVGGDSKQQRQGVISSIAVYLSGIAAVTPGTWTLRQFIESEDDSRLFIVNTKDTNAMFAPLYRLMLTVGFAAIASKQEIVHADRYWFYLDELHVIGDIKLDEQVATLRKYGVAVVTGIQSESQLVTSLGKDRADTVTNCFNTALLLRANEPAMQERIANRLGKLEMDTVARNQALAVTEWRDGAALNKTEHEKWLVMPAEIGALAACNGWIKLAGAYPAARVDYSGWLRKGMTKARPYVDRFGPVQPLPERDPGFQISRQKTEDALASLKSAYEQHQEELAAEEKAKAIKAAETGAVTGEPPEQPKSTGGKSIMRALKGRGVRRAQMSLIPTEDAQMAKASAGEEAVADLASRDVQHEQSLAQLNQSQSLDNDGPLGEPRR